MNTDLVRRLVCRPGGSHHESPSRSRHHHRVPRVLRAVGLVSLLTAGFTGFAYPASATVVALWHMDEPTGPGNLAGGTMIDSAGAVGGTNNGTIGGTVTSDAGLVSGNAYAFGGTSSYVEVPDNGSLDPVAQNMAVAATVRTVGGTMPDDSYDLVRKGLTTTAGGDWKMEIKRAADPTVGKLNCVFKGVMADGRRVAVARIANVNLNDGRQHTVKCIKTPTSVQAVVDGRTFTTSKTTGSIDNNAAVIVGAKSASDDVLQGTMDEVSVDIG
jgi:hypothetical protein